MQTIFRNIWFFLFLSASSYGQNNSYFDSLQKTLPNLSEKEQINTVIAIPFDKMNSNTSRALQLYENVLVVANANGDSESIAQLYEKLRYLFD